MNEIICPHCEKAFKIDEAGYSDILKQVRNKEFEKDLHERLELAESEKNAAVELAKATIANQLILETSKKDAEIERLKSEMNASESNKKMAVMEAVNDLVKERDDLARDIPSLGHQAVSKMTQIIFPSSPERASLGTTKPKSNVPNRRIGDVRLRRIN